MYVAYDREAFYAADDHEFRMTFDRAVRCRWSDLSLAGTTAGRLLTPTGQSLLEMIQAVRLENVCRLLATTSLPMLEVGERSGYDSTSNLSCLFRKRFGMTMSDYRDQNAKP
jgi:AraC-like DNA-binding protein